MTAQAGQMTETVLSDEWPLRVSEKLKEERNTEWVAGWCHSTGTGPHETQHRHWLGHQSDGRECQFSPAGPPRAGVLHRSCNC